MRDRRPQNPSNPIGSAAAWTSRGKLVCGGNLDCKGVIAQGFLCLGSLSAGTQLELFHPTVPLNKLLWRMETLLRET